MRPLTLLPILLVACGPEIDHPSGDCQADDDGSRLCYHSPEPGDTYLPDCEAPLQREYWRVFAQSEDSAYVIPRPDGATALAQLCEEADEATAALLESYTLCGQTDIDLVNAMDPADALEITHLLHERLAFTVVDLGEGYFDVDPFVPMDDVLAACETAGAELDAYCEFQESRVDGDGCTDIAYLPTEEEAVALAAAVNALYGIAAD